MKTRRTHVSNGVFRLPGGTEDNDLFVEKDTDSDGAPILRSTWEPSELERELIAAGHNIELITWGASTPPVFVTITDVPLGRPPRV